MHTASTRAILEGVSGLMEPLLLPDLPPLTEPVTRRLAYARDPGGDQSFGSVLCAALAPGVLALVNDLPSAADPVSVLVDALIEARISPQQPWSGAAVQ
jgi:hypothetical protein